jgi:hypothetical protein
MGGVDIANRYRADFTTLRRKNYRYWKPLFHWLLDIVLTNSYLLAKASQTPRIGESKDYYSYRRFLELLYKALIAYNKGPEHRLVLRSKRTYCAYCRNNQLNWQPKKIQPQRRFGVDITNIRGGLTNIKDSSRGQFRGSQSQWGCIECNIALCKVGDCWRLWHRNLN